MVTILLSPVVQERFGPRLQAAFGGHAHRIVHLDAPPGPDGDFGIDAAFLSRDITGRSTKFKISETMERFFHMLEHSRNLRWVQTHSAGADRPVWKPIKARGITMTTGGGALAGTVAVTAVGGVIALARRFPEAMDAQRRHAWEPLLEDRSPPDLAGTSALVVGLGPIGGEIARLLRAIGLRVTGARPEARPHEHCDEVISYAEVRSRLPGTDWLVLACPLTDMTRGIVDGAGLASLPKGAHVVNVARGEVIVEKEFIEVLRSGHLGGAWLDVFEVEPLDPASPLWDLPRVMVSPHSSGHAQGNYDRVAGIFLDNLGRFVAGEPLRNVVQAGR
ncbi:Glyoxylate/hydroxypyruvate reductase A [Usitatibacter rugosus]|uniref:Glyoxylate/hydroxypyruvate reductase A n=1 Tax=Usitatibacter rugosus TaxID=2732067 RepID=A0A6M4GQR9_9PROT|nr:D-2-hydroxyacid dehydrogenase [Usitatibacter rugosus]QJR09406.1 Glyoxylate/hydroxypyruvate reductase A [Usitatibacter rugosus]